MSISEEATRLYEFLVEQYIRSGYLYSGSQRVNCAQTSALVAPADPHDVVEELIGAALVQVRDCRVYSIELPPARRVELLQEHKLNQIWKQRIEAKEVVPNVS